jgi:hypothetical protein
MILFKTFDKENYLNNEGTTKYIFSTEGHLFPIKYKYFLNKSKLIFDYKSNSSSDSTETNIKHDCKLDMNSKDYFNLVNDLPIQSKYLNQVFDMVGVNDEIEKLLVRTSS